MRIDGFDRRFVGVVEHPLFVQRVVLCHEDRCVHSAEALLACDRAEGGAAVACPLPDALLPAPRCAPGAGLNDVRCKFWQSLKMQ